MELKLSSQKLHYKLWSNGKRYGNHCHGFVGVSFDGTPAGIALSSYSSNNWKTNLWMTYNTEIDSYTEK